MNVELSQKVVLIFTPIDKKYQDAFTHYAPPLGLVALENFLFCHGITIKILDGSIVYTKEDIISYLLKEKRNLFHLSSLSFTSRYKLSNSSTKDLYSPFLNFLVFVINVYLTPLSAFIE